MKNKILLLLFSIFISVQTFAQKEMWGVTKLGGQNVVSSFGIGWGTIFKTDSAGGNPTVVHYFDSINGKYPAGKLFQASNGKIYGTASSGGYTLTPFSQGGVLFEYDLTIDSFRAVCYFGGPQFAQGLFPLTGVIEPTPGILYGSTGGGGIGGMIYQFNMSTGITSLSTAVPSFLSSGLTISNWINGNLLKAGNGILYGATARYSSFPNGSPYLGSIISLNTSGNTFSYVHPLNYNSGIEGYNPTGSLVELGAGKLYGTTQTGGMVIGPDPLGDGILFEYDYLTNIFTKKTDFNPVLGFGPTPLVAGPNNKLYGVTSGGGTNLFDTSQHVGTLFEFDPVTDVITVKHNFGSDGAGTFTGVNPNNPLLFASNGNLYGMDHYSGIFEYNPLTNAVVQKSSWSQNPDFYDGGNELSGLIEICRKPSYKYFYTDTFTVCKNNNFNYTVHSTNANSYQWNKNGSALAAQTDSIINFTNIQLSDSGIYTCTMQNQCGQTETMNLVIKVSLCTGMDEQFGIENAITLAPNPAAHFLQLQITDHSIRLLKQILLKNMLGQTVLQNSSGNRNLDMTNLPHGIYLVEVQTNKGLWVGKVMKN